MGNELDKMRPENVASFSNGYEQKVLPPGTVLHRFTQGINAPVFSDCWMDHTTYSKLITEIQSAGGHAGIRSSEGWKRSRLWEGMAILSSWNRLSHRVKITLTREIVAYEGETGPQYLYISSSALGFHGGGRTTGATDIPEEKAPFNGRVMNIERNHADGLHILIRKEGHQEDMKVSHLERVLVKRNQLVKKGQAVGHASRVMKRVELRKGGQRQIVIPRFYKDQVLRKVRNQEKNDAAIINLNQYIF